MIPARFSHILFSLLLSGMMSCLVSGVATLKAVGLVEGVFWLWMGSWVSSWAIAFPAVILVAPLARRMVAAMVRQPG